MQIYLNQNSYLAKNFDDLSPAELDGAKHEAHKIAQQLATSKISDDVYHYLLGNLASMRQGRKRTVEVSDVNPNESEIERKFRQLFEGIR